MYIQEGRPVAYLLQKLTKSQQLYHHRKGNAFHCCNSPRILRYAPRCGDIHVFTDHKNLTFDTLKMQHVLCWHTKIEEFSPILCPLQCLHDKGGEFMRQNFQWLLEIFSIKDVCSTSKILQSNAICERMHQSVTNVLRTLVHTNPPQNMTQARDILDNTLATAMHAMQTTVATTLGGTPGALAFAQDMFLMCC
jgi:hypothetical protein